MVRLDMKKKRSFARFYAIAKEKHIDLSEHKETLVSQFTDGRTDSLREMTEDEYEEMCDCLQSGRPAGMSKEEFRSELRYLRSGVLKRLQKLGVDTSDDCMVAVNNYCLSPKIAGKPFGLLTLEELRKLIPKLEAILRKKRTEQPKPLRTIPIFINPNQLPS